jgi:hypothetical protein
LGQHAEAPNLNSAVSISFINLNAGYGTSQRDAVNSNEPTHSGSTCYSE